MKMILSLLLVSSMILTANDLTNTIKKENYVSSKNINQNMLKNKEIESLLRKVLKDVKKYKEQNINKRQKLLDQLDEMKKELKRTNKQLELKNKKLFKTKKELLKEQKKAIRKDIQEREKRSSVVVHKKVERKQKTKSFQNPILIEDVVIHKVIETPKALPTVPWVEVIVENDLNIYDLALQYYGDSQQYEKIYVANQNVIDQDYQISNGMSLIIPITETFEDQPMFLNNN